MTTRWEVFKVDAYYVALPFLPVAPKIGDPRDADSILSQAYGRNDYTDEELPDIIAEVRALGMHNDHMTMGVLKQRGFRPGVPNLALADRCITLAKLYGLPIYAQWEVAYGIFDLDPDWYFQNKERITALWPDQ
ncbi:MAG TPA: hypothetical protein VD998_02560, partial [Verrucomicrobiae bacterium]|nr:hypothetical protein [Verrucomicrobiae bacterium]